LLDSSKCYLFKSFQSPNLY